MQPTERLTMFIFSAYKASDLFGEQYLFKFTNGFGAYVRCMPGSYGYEHGLYELALIKWDDDKWIITDSDFGDDAVVGFLNVDDVNQTLEGIVKFK